MAITLASYLLVAVFCVAVGVVLDRIFMRPAPPKVAANTEAEPKQQLAQEILQRVHSVAENIMVDVNSHGATIRDVGDRLNGVDVARDGIDSVVRLVTELAESNAVIQGKLAEAESKLDHLTAQISRHHVEARTDALTGCANRRAFDEELVRHVQQHEADGTTFSVVMIDIDHFKQVNDIHGHQVGDSVLRMVGRTLRHHVRKTDVIARYGGEEFAVILPDAGVEVACRAAEALRREVERLIVPLSEGSMSVTISAGAADTRVIALGADPVQFADTALYAAKRGGRNRVYWHDGESPRPLAEETNEEEKSSRKPAESPAAERKTDLPPTETLDRERAAAAFDNLPTKTAFCQEVRRRIAEWNRGGKTVSVALISLENWREIETTHGPSGSYRALCAVAATLKEEIREMDLLARYDGSMFGLMMPAATEQSALVIGERLRKAVEQQSVTVSGEAIALRVACGTAQVSQGDDDAVPLLRRAEEALQRDRGQLCVAHGETA